MTQEQKNAERAEKAASKAADAAIKKAAKDKERADKVAAKNTIQNIKEPDRTNAADVELTTSVVDVTDLQPDSFFNRLDAKTATCIHQIVKAADVCLNTNTEANIQNQLCIIIRQSLRAYALHTGNPFDTEIG